MESFELAILTRWESFYVIIGSSAAALTGLQFVVIALGAEGHAIKTQAVRAYATPTVVHFCEVLLVSAALSAPWQNFAQVATALAACGLIGFGYTLMVIRHARKQTDYTPVFEDWLFHSILPLIGYSSILTASALLQRNPTLSLFLTGGTTILLLFVGIHNAWDAAIYIAIDRSRKDQADNRPQPSEPKRSKSHKRP